MYYVIYYIHALHILHYLLSFGRKTHTCILKVAHLLYGVSEVRFHRNALVPCHASVLYCFLVDHRQWNKNKHILCIISRPAVTDSKKRRVIFNSVHSVATGGAAPNMSYEYVY